LGAGGSIQSSRYARTLPPARASFEILGATFSDGAHPLVAAEANGEGAHREGGKANFEWSRAGNNKSLALRLSLIKNNEPFKRMKPYHTDPSPQMRSLK